MMTLDKARAVMEAGERRAREIEQPMNVAVVDAGGVLVAHMRMDGAWIGSVDIAINKAYTARAFDMPTEDLAGTAQSGGPLFGINTTNDNRIVIFPGGIPLSEDGEIVGAVGVSGGTVDQDQDVAQAAADAFG
jgi:uncharacterized protein GlcG (DUF336 family)